MFFSASYCPPNTALYQTAVVKVTCSPWPHSHLASQSRSPAYTACVSAGVYKISSLLLSSLSPGRQGIRRLTHSVLLQQGRGRSLAPLCALLTPRDGKCQPALPSPTWFCLVDARCKWRLSSLLVSLAPVIGKQSVDSSVSQHLILPHWCREGWRLSIETLWQDMGGEQH